MQSTLRTLGRRMSLLFLVGVVHLEVRAATPPNDQFANRIQISGAHLFLEGDLTGGTMESGEPQHPIPQWLQQGPASRSIWWQWTPPSGGGIVLDPRASTFFRKGVYIYRGDALQSLTLVSSSYGDDAAQATVEAGETYFICAASDGGEGPVIISLRHHPQAPNDNFANRITISGTHVTVPLNLFGTTVEPNEPAGQFGEPFGNGAWCEWIAPVDGNLTVYADGCRIEKFEGSSLSDLRSFGQPFGVTEEVLAGQRIFFRFSVFPDTQRGLFKLNLTHDFARILSPRGGTYQVGQPIPIEIGFAPTDEPVKQIDFYSQVHCAGQTELVVGSLTTPPWRVELTPTNAYDHRALVRILYTSGREQFIVSDCFQVRNPSPPNDNRADAAIIDPAGGSAPIVALLGATLEPAEENLWPFMFGGIGSAWWKWTPLNSGAASIMAPAATIVRVFKGANFEPVNFVTAETLFRFPVTSGETYWIGLRPSSDFVSNPSHQLTVTPGLPSSVSQNDDFAARLPLSGSGQLTADLTFATQETGEPGVGDSLWWSWSAQESGLLEIEANSATELLLDFVSLVDVVPYRGSSVTELTQVTAQYGTWPDQSLRFRVTAGEDIALRLSRSRSTSDARAFFRYTFFPDPGNDAFASRAELAGLPVVLRTRFSSAAMIEANEPRPFNLFRSQWWSWTSPYHGPVGMAVHSMSAALGLAIFEGSDLSGLTRIHAVTNEAGLLILTAEQGRTYHFQVNGSTDTEFLLHLSAGEPNDHFADSIPLASTNGLLAASNLNASHEPGERTRVPGPPPFSTLPLSGSLWWQFTAPIDGQLTLRHRPFQWVYRDQWTGEAIDSLQQLTRNYFNDSDWIAAKIKVTEGQTIHVSLDTLAHTFNATPIPQSMLLEHDFSSLQIAQPIGHPEFRRKDSVVFALKPSHSEFDGEIREVTLRFGKRRSDGTFDYQGTPPGWPVRLTAPFTHTLSDWPAGTYEVTARAVNSSGKLRVSAPELFTIGPANDDFTNRLSAIMGRTTVETLAGTSLESFETNLPAPIRGSAWWQWIAPWTAPAFIEDTNPVAVYQGTDPGALRLITNGAGNVRFLAQAGEAYQVALLRAQGDANFGPVSFNISMAPEGDDFADRRRIPLYEGGPNGWQFEGRHLTLEEGEPNHGVIDAGGSVWWEITVTNRGTLTANFGGHPNGSTELRLYRGAAFGELDPVALSPIDGFNFGAELDAGIYQAAIITRTNPPNQSAQINLSFRSAAPNDNFVNAAILQGTSGTVATPFWFGTVESSEPYPYWFPPEIPQPSQVPLVQTLWWKWTAPRTGNLDIVIPEHLSWTFQPQFKVELFQGDTLSTFLNVPVRSQYRVHTTDDTILDFEVTQGETYYIRAGYGNEFGQQGGMFAFRFALSDGVVTNDVVQNAPLLEGSNFRVEGHTAGAREGFVYYNWRPIEEGLAFFDTSSSNVYITVLCFDGDSNLVSNALVPPKSALHVRSGNTVRFAVFGYTPAPFEFTVNLVPGRPNDDYASRQILTGTSGSFFANALYGSGTFGPNGEATTDRTLYWEWVAPHAGQLTFTNPDGSPAPIYILESGGAQSVTRIIAGRTYMFSYFGREPRHYVYRLHAEDLVPTFSRSGDNLRFALEAPDDSVLRIDVSTNLFQWNSLGLFQAEDGIISLPENVSHGERRFFRLSPLW